MSVARCDVKSALVGAVTDAVGDSAAVRWAPSRDPETTDYVVFGAPQQGGDEVASLRPRPVAVTDEWTIDVACVAWTRGEYAPEATDRRCEVLVGAVVDAVRSNPSVPAEACVMGVTVDSVDGPSFGGDDIGGFSFGLVTVRVKQRIG